MIKNSKEMTRKEKTEEIITIFVKLGICEPRTKEERQAVEERRQKIGAEKFDSRARAAYIDIMAFIAALETEATEQKSRAGSSKP